MNAEANQSIAAAAIGDRVDSGLGPKQNPTVGKDCRAALPHDAYGSTVDKPNDKAGKRKKNSSPAPTVPDDVTRKVRRGATIAMILAAGISARTLFQLGQIIGLPWQFAWMLPGAFDVYAYTSATVAASIPAAHPARKWAVWNARIALSFTMIGNSLVHALYLMSNNQGWTGTDYALTAVSAIPPIIVERLLHLQTKIVSGAEAAVATPATPPAATPRPRTPATATPVAEPVAATTPATPKPQPAATRNATKPVAKPVAAADGNGVVATLVPKAERLQILRNMIAEQGPDIPLAEITELFNVHKSTASRDLEEAKKPPKDEGQADERAEGVS